MEVEKIILTCKEVQVWPDDTKPLVLLMSPAAWNTIQLK